MLYWIPPWEPLRKWLLFVLNLAHVTKHQSLLLFSIQICTTTLNSSFEQCEIGLECFKCITPTTASTTPQHPPIVTCCVCAVAGIWLWETRVLKTSLVYLLPTTVICHVTCHRQRHLTAGSVLLLVVRHLCSRDDDLTPRSRSFLETKSSDCSRLGGVMGVLSDGDNPDIWNELCPNIDD